MREEKTNHKSSTTLRLSSPTESSFSQKASSQPVIKIWFLLFALILSSQFASAAWANASFDKCMNITINNSGAETLTNFPAYIDLTHDNTDMLPDFKDIRFYSNGCNSGGTLMDYEIENYTTSTQAHIWTRIPNLPSTGTKISVYYKNNTAITSGQNPTGVWDSNYKMVQHFEESCNTANCTKDSTQYQNNGTPYSSTTITNLFNASGKIGPAYSFDGIDDGVIKTNAQTLNLTGKLTLCAWIKLNTRNAAEDDFISFCDENPNCPYLFGTSSSGYLQFGWYNTGATEVYSTALAYWQAYLGEWHHVCAVRVSDSNVSLYIDGVSQDIDHQNDVSVPSAPTGNMYLGQIANTYYSNTTLDEARISDTNRSANWINMSYQIVANQSQYVSFGTEESQTTAIVNISSCQVLSSPNTVYALNTSIIGNSGACLNITASNVIIDGRGFSITYGVTNNNSYAIFANGSSMITVKDLLIFQTNSNRTNSHAIYFINSNSNNITNVTFDIYGKAGSSNGGYNYGAYFYNTANSSISQCNFSMRQGCDYCHGILLSTGSSFINISNNYISAQGDIDSRAIYSLNSNNQRIINNSIAQSVQYNYGTIHFYNTDNSVIENNTMTTYTSSFGYLLRIASGSDYNVIKNNQLTGTGTTYFIYINASSDYTNISLMNITTTYYSPIDIASSSGTRITDVRMQCPGSCIDASSADNGIIDRVNLTSSGSTSYRALYFSSSDNWTMNNTDITCTSGATGIQASGGMNNSKVQNTRIQTINSEALQFSSLEGTITIKDSYLNATNSSDLLSTSGSGTINITNVTYNDKYWHYGSSTLNVFFYLDVHVNDTVGSELDSAIVTIYDKDSQQAASIPTNSTGRIERQEILYTTQSDNDFVAYKTPHTINVTMEGYHSKSISLDMDQNQAITITLTPDSLPEITINSPVDERTYASSTVLINITNTSNTGHVWYNWNGTNSTYTEPILVDVGTGAINLTVYANNSEGIASESISFNVSDIINISGCQKLTSPDMTYRITQDINSTLGICIEIQANNISIDGQGHTISYALNGSGIGIMGIGYNDLRIQDLRLYKPNTIIPTSPAIKLHNSRNNNISRVNISVTGLGYSQSTGGSNLGFYFYNTSNTTLQQINLTTLNECYECHGIYMATGSDNNTIRDSTILAQGRGYGIMSYYSSGLVVEDSSIIGSTGSWTAPAIQFTKSNNNIINRTNVTATGDTYAINFITSGNSSVMNSNINTQRAYGGIRIVDYSQNINLSSVNVTSTSYSAVFISNVSRNTEINVTMISCTDRCIDIQTNCNGGTVDNANLTGNGGSSGVFYLTSADNWAINNTNITAIGDNNQGAYLSSGANITIQNTKVQTSGATSAEALNVYGTNPLLIKDSILNSTYDTDIYFVSDTTVLNLTNVSFIDKYWAGGTATLNMFWYLSTYVNDTMGNPVEGANVTTYDVNHNQLSTSLSNSTGRIDPQTVLSYIQTSNVAVSYKTPHNINVSKSGYYTTNESTDVSANTEKTITLTAVTRPDITIMSPQEGQIYANTTVLINITNSSNTNNLWYRWNNTNYTYTGPAYFDFKIEGQHNLTAFANNSNGTSTAAVTFNISLGGMTIADCQELTSPDITYRLSQDINSSSGVCFEVKANNITLDGQGHSLLFGTSGQGTGVHASNYGQLTVKNFTFNQNSTTSTNSYAVHLENSQDNNISDCIISIYGSENPDAQSKGIYLYNTTRSTIQRNSIIMQSGCDYCYGLEIKSGSHNTTVRDNSLQNYGTASESIRSLESHNNLISNNTISSSPSYSYGSIHVWRSNDTIINETTLSISPSSFCYGIHIDAYSDRNLITNSRIITAEYYAILIDNRSDDNNITWTNITSTSHSSIYINSYSYRTTIDHVQLECTYGCIYLTLYAPYGSIDNSIITGTSGSSNLGAINLGGSNWTINNTNVTTTGETVGISVDESDTEIQNTRVQTSGNAAHALYLSSVGLTTVMDSAFNATNGNDTQIYSSGSGPINFTGVNFTDKAWASSSTPFNVFWHLNVYVNDTLGNGIEGANVSAVNSTLQLIFSDSTNSTGYIQQKDVLEYTQTGVSTVSYQTNYSVRAEKNNYLPDQKSLNITSNADIFLTLESFACGIAYDSPGTYNLTNDISSTGTCINIASNNIMIECNGHSITGNRNGIGINNSGGYSNITVQRCLVQNFTQAINFNNSVNVTFKDSILQNSSIKEVVVGGTSNITFVNTTFNESSTTISGGQLNVRWFLELYVNNSKGEPVVNVNLTAKDKYGTQYFTELTNSSGYIQRKNLTEYYENITTRYYYTNYTINITSAVSAASNISINLTASTLQVITLTTKGYEDSCTDSLDNDGDGAVDFNDFDCMCDVGNDTTTCWISTNHTPRAVVYKLNNLVMQLGGILINATRNSSIFLNATGNVSMEANATILATNITIYAGNLSIGPNATINTSFMGYTGGSGDGGAGSGSGAGTGHNAYAGGGAGHGGKGGTGGNGGAGGVGYGNITYPTLMGSGGGAGDDGGTDSVGGDGGGIVFINSYGRADINGSVLSIGEVGLGGTSTDGGGGGAGGSIIIQANTLTGTGNISANGGTGGNSTGYDGGGGAGGRIAIYYTANSFAGLLTAKGGSGNQTYVNNGGAGTIYLKASSEAYGGLIVNNYQIATTAITNITDDYIFKYANLTNATLMGSQINITDALNILPGITYLNNPIVGTSTVWVQNNSVLKHTANGGTQVYILNLSCSNLTIEKDGSIGLIGVGYAGGISEASGSGPGAGTGHNAYAGGGAGHGGTGAAGINGGAGGIIYDSIAAPIEIGSGGGSGDLTSNGGGGGGLVVINAGTVNIIGNITANGENGTVSSSNDGGGGGSGGSIIIQANTLIGTGNIQSDGGRGGNGAGYDGGGGAGGRISINYQANTYTGAITATGGAGNISGSDGTVFLCTSTSGVECPGVSGDVYLNILTPNSTININRTITQSWNQSFVKWNDSSSIQSNYTYNAIGLIHLRDYDVYNNSQKLLTLLADESGELPNFYINLSSNHEIIVQTANQTSVIINSPVDSANISSTPIDFNCTAMSNYELVNISLFLNNSGWASYDYIEWSGTTNTTIFSESLDDGYYTWNCYACDAVGSCNFASANRALVLDTVIPNINQLNPGNNTDWSTDNVTFIYTVSDANDLFNCTLYINDIENISSSTITRDENQSFSVILENGQYNWTINCTDRSLNIATGGIYNLTVADVTAPVITIVNPENNGWLNNNTESVIINITTDENANCKYIQTDSGFDFETQGTLFTNTGEKIHTFNYSGLTPTTSHTFYYKCNDSKNNINSEGEYHYFQVAEGICDRGTYTTTCWINSSKTYNGFLSLNNLVIEATGSLTHSSNTITQAYSLNISCANLTIDSGGIINLTGKGYAAGNGTGGGTTSPGGGSGAGHGGIGACSANEGSTTCGATGGNNYDSITQPTQIGSGGGYGNNGANAGGKGGGLIIINATGTITNNGTITTNGENGTGATDTGGGGSGGSIWLTANTIKGNGTINAQGGHAGKTAIDYGGGGAGGRIAIHYTTKTYTGKITATGASGYKDGGAGTIYLKSTIETNGGIIINNNEYNTGITNISDALTLDWLNITNATTNGTAITIINSLNVLSGTTYLNNLILGTSNVIIFNNSMLRHTANSNITAHYLNITCNNLTIEKDGRIEIVGQGYASGNGTGAGAHNADGGGGAGYGGAGGCGGNSGSTGCGGGGGASYGSITSPNELGSGGGNGDNAATSAGGSGGGLVIINAAGTISIKGNITAYGDDGTGASDSGGGGSGGSVYLTAYNFEGNGIINANGGNGATTGDDGGGGAGGRIALIYTTLCNETTLLTTLTNVSSGGTGYQNGENGTVIYSCINTAPTANLSTPGNNTAQSMTSINFSWDYYDGAGDPQFAYQLVVDNDSDFSSPEFNITANTTNESIILENFNSTVYYWKVKVQDLDTRTNMSDYWSEWSDTWQFTTTDVTINWVNASPSIVSPGESINITANVTGGAVNAVKVLLDGTYWPMSNGGSGNIYWNDSVSTAVSANHIYTVYANDSTGYEVSKSGNILVVNLNISINLNPNPAALSDNVSIYGRINLTNGSNIPNNLLSIYINNSLYYLNNNTGFLENATAWWNTSFGHRTKINITSQVASNLNSTIVLTNLSTSDLISQAKMRSDCGDARFADSNNNELQYTIETSTCNTANTIYWVWANLTGNADNTIYAYYGNSAATLKTDYTNPDSRLVLYLHLDNSSAYGENSSRFFDFSKSGNNATCTVCPALNSTGRYGRGYSLNGSSYMNVSNNPFSFTNNFSISLWAYIVRTGVAQTFVSKAEAGGYDLALNATNYILFAVYNASGYKNASSNSPLSANQWYHIVSLVNGNKVQLYVNGVLQNRQDSVGGSITTVSYSLGVGVNPGASLLNYFNGTLDEIRIFNKTLSADEVLSIYNSTANNYIENHSMPRTDSNGNYNYPFAVQSTQGSYIVKANTTYNSMYAEANSVLTMQAAYINITLNLAPNPANLSQNISFHGHLNQSNGINISNNPIFIYINNSPHYNNLNTGLLDNATAWWNTGFAYRTKINITSYVTSNINNTIVLVNLSTSNLIAAGKMSNSCGDTRFTNANGIELQYTLETSTCNETNTIYWVWTNLTGNANSTIYAYYGNSSAALKTDYTNPDSSLILYYHFDNDTAYGENSTKTFDFSKGNNNGTIIGTPTWNSTGRYGGAYNLNEEGDSGDYIQAASSTAFDFTNFTYSAWINSDLMGGGWGTIIDVDNDEQQLAIDRATAGKPYAIYGRCGEVKFTNAAVGWRHLAWTVSGSNYVVYENGTIIGSGSGCSSSTEGDYLVIGSGYGGNEYFSGLMDEVRVYNRSLSPDEVLAIYNSTANNYIENHSLPRTDSNGNYNYTWSTATAGTYTVKVNTTYNSMYAEAAGTLTVSQSGGLGINCTAFKCLIIRAAGSPVAIFDALGAVDLKATLIQSASTAPGASDFIIRNSTGTPVAWINTTGHLLIRGSLVENTGAGCTPPPGAFFIRGNNSECVAYVNNTGDLYLKGDLRESAIT